MLSTSVFAVLRSPFTASRRAVSTAFLIALASMPLHAQQVIIESQSSIVREIPTQNHFRLQPGQPIDIGKLPEDVLNCDECRRRLGLPPLVKPTVEKIVAQSGPSEAKSIATNLNDKNKPSETIPEPKLETASGSVKATASNATKKELLQSASSSSTESSSSTKSPDVKKPDSNLSGFIKSKSQSESPKQDPRTPPASPSPSDSMIVEGTLISPATQKIEIEILKKQLQERDNHLKKFSAMQSDVEQRIDQLVRMNEEFAKKDAARQIETDRLQKTSEQTLQARELELSNLKAELSSVRAEAREQAKRLSDQLAETDSAKSKEIAKLSNELIEAKQARVDAMANLRIELAESQKKAMSETSKAISEQLKTIELQRTNIRELETQMANAEKVQQEDASRIEKLRKELASANAARVKVTSDPATQTTSEKANESKDPKTSETAKAEAKSKSKSKPKNADELPPASVKTDPSVTKATPSSSKEAEPRQAPIENEPTTKRRSF